MNDKHDAERERILRDIDRATEPAKMSQPEAYEWLQTLTSDLEARTEALAEEISLKRMGEDPE